MTRLIGYARVSTDEQELRGQLDTLKDYGCQTIFQDKASGARAERPGLTACLEALEEGDTLVVWRLDRLGRSMAHLVKTIEELRLRGVAFKSISDGVIDTASPSGQLIFHIFAALAEFERGLIRERTRAGLAAARARGRKGGRKPIKASDPRVKQARSLHKEGSMSIGEICDSMGISKATLYRYLKLE